MQYLQRLPLLLALAAAITMGFIGFIRSQPQKDIMLHMVLVMVLFYIVGLFTRATLQNTIDQVEEKRKEKELEEMKKKQEEEEQHKKEKSMETEGIGRNIDFTAGNMDEDVFEPLPVSEFIKKELKRN